MKLRTRYPTVRLWTVFLAVTPFILPFTFVIGELSCKYNFKTTFKDDQENQETSERNGTKDERGSIQVCVFVSFDEAKYYFQMAITKFASGGKNNYEGITVGGKRNDYKAETLYFVTENNRFCNVYCEKFNNTTLTEQIVQKDCSQRFLNLYGLKIMGNIGPGEDTDHR